jgi:hypothetical protein
MSRMIRKQIYLEARQDRRVKQVAQTGGLTEAEVIRAALDGRYLYGEERGPEPDETAWAEALAFMESMRPDGSALKRPLEWKRDDLYEDRS